MNVAFAGFRHGHVYSALRAIRSVPELKITAAWESDEAAARAAAEHGIDNIYSDYDKMLAQNDIDILVMCDYYTARGEKTIKALKKGIHVYSDKPICTSSAELLEIERLIIEKNLCMGCVLDLRCYGAAAAAKENVGRLGEIHNISFGGQHPLNYGSRPSWYFQKGCHGGTINDIAVHGIDLVRYITGKGIKSVSAARSWNAYAKEEPDFADCAQFMAILDGDTGLIADVSYSMPYPLKYSVPQKWRFTFWGENGIMEFSGVEDCVYLSLKDKKETEIIKGNRLTENPFYDFLSEINGKPTALNTAEIIKASHDTLILQEICDKSKNYEEIT